MNRNLKIGLISVGAILLVVGGVVWYRRMRITSGHKEKDTRRVKLFRTSNAQAEEVVNDAEEIL
jgi:hypothetical protein